MSLHSSPDTSLVDVLSDSSARDRGLQGVRRAILRFRVDRLDTSRKESQIARLTLTISLLRVRRFGVAMRMIEKCALMARLAIRARQTKMPVDTSTIIGLMGRAETTIAPEGTIFLRNELWHARSHVNIAAGERVRVTGLAGLTLVVCPDRNGEIDER